MRRCLVLGLDSQSALPWKKWIAIGVQYIQSPGLIAQQKTVPAARGFRETETKWTAGRKSLWIIPGEGTHRVDEALL